MSLHAKDALPERPVRLDSQKALTQCDEARNVQHHVGSQIVQLHSVYKQQPTKKFEGWNRKAVEEKGHENYPESHRWVRGVLSAWQAMILGAALQPSTFL
jgi:hypothetical protein